MPFSRGGVWAVPVEADHTAFQSQIMSKRQEIAPTQEMIDAIAANLPPEEANPTRTDVFGAIGRLKGPVDIVIPVYGGLHVLKPCIESVIKHTRWDYRLIIVDDASPDPEIKKYLKKLDKDRFLEEGYNYRILYNNKNRGFAPTANRGVAEGDSPYICILNSDTLVTEGWMTRQLMALEADEKNVIVNPVTNNTALINVQMHAGSSYLDMADALAIAPNTLTYNEIMPTGFCFTMKRKLWDEVGPFDEAYISYGEELTSIDQPVLTPLGWSTIGNLQPGDVVFSEEGKQVKVLGSTPIETDRRCYEITFDTGEKITTDHSHRWKVATEALIRAKTQRGDRSTIRSESHNRRLKAKELYDSGLHYKEVAKHLKVSTRTAQEYLARYRAGTIDKHYGKRELTLSTEDMFLQGIACKMPSKGNCFNFKIPAAPLLSLDEKPLLMDPYCLGVWLGDGNTDGPGLTFIDLEMLDEFKKNGYDVSTYNEKAHRVKQPFTPQLKALGVLGNKHIPTDYLFGSADQRLALLQGLMDTDGHCTEEGKCSFDNTNMDLIEGVTFLVRSLGMKAHRPQPSRKEGYVDCHRVIFRATKDTPVFRLTRKSKNQVTKTRNRVNYHAITDIKPVAPVPVRCISVDSPNRLFLISKSLIATHNTDFWFKAIKQTDKSGVILKNKAVIADNAYVFHERGTSFSQLGEEEHMGLRRSGSSRFNELHPDFASWQYGFSPDSAVNHLRNELPRDAFKKKFKGNVAWVVKSAGMCGGMNFIADIVNEMIEQGYNAKVCVVPDNFNPEDPNAQPVIPNLRTAPILFKSQEEFTSEFTQRVFPKGKVFAGVTELTPIVWDIAAAYKGIQGFNHAQSYDPDLARILNKDELAEGFEESYLRLPNIVSSHWVANKIKDLGGTVDGVVLPGVNPDLFHCRNRNQGDDRFTLAILFSDFYLFKGAKWAREFLKALSPEKQTHMRILAIGPKSLDIRGITCLGEVSQAKMADLLGGEIDVLVDPSELHSYGMPALEALASGCRVITRPNRGINEIEGVWRDRVTVEEDPALAVAAALTLAENAKYGSLPVRAYALEPEANRFKTVPQFIDMVFPAVCANDHRIEVITPHLRKHGGPTTIIALSKQLQALNHDVSMSTIYTDWSPEVINMGSGINIRTAWEEVPEDVELVIINSDNPFAKQIMTKWPDKKYVMFKLSHNPRFQAVENENLNLSWDHIMTSTEWLREACLTPMGGKWDHQAWDPDKVTTVGWYHYGHAQFNMPPPNRTYGCAQAGFRVGTLIHKHNSKGTMDAMATITGLKKHYEANIHAAGFGEIRMFDIPWYMQYFRNAGRKDMSFAFKQLDIWLGASHSEGLGRMSLEAMSAGVAVVTTDTGAEFLKNGENCLLYDVQNPQRAAELIREAVSDKVLFKKLILGGHATAEAAASPIAMRQKLNLVIKKVLES